MSTIRTRLSRDDAISPIIATILLIAATVVLGATIYAATTGFGSKTPQADVGDATFIVKAADTDGNSLTDAVRITYVKGPPLGGAAVILSIRDASDGDDMVDTDGDGDADADNEVTGFEPPATDETWDAGDIVMYDVDEAPQSYIVTVTVSGTTLYSTDVRVEETS